ncbi:MAG: HNH endonuclease [Rhodobacteraceae bacterium]|nr:HNH endonuclease [Paracoccaceae bacterium]
MKVPPLTQRHGHRGVAHLRIAVLEVLYAARKAKQCIGPAEISRRAGIFREGGYAMKGGNDFIVAGVLNSLVKDTLLDKCHQRNGRGGWRLTDQAFARRDKEATDLPDWGGDMRIIDAYRIKQWGFCPGCLAVLPKRPDVDHIQAKASGGSGQAENKQLLCPNCNRRRGAKPFEAFVHERRQDGIPGVTDYEPDDNS